MRTLLCALLLPLAAAASALEVGPIAVSGAGSIFLDSSTREYWMQINFSGSDAAGDSVTVAGYSANCAFSLDGLSFGDYFGFGYLYTGSINGLQGDALFSNIGGGWGLVQIYAVDPRSSFYYVGALLAETRVVTTTEVMDKVNFPGGATGSREDFTLVDPPIDSPENVPEPETWALGLIGLVTLFTASLRCRLS